MENQNYTLDHEAIQKTIKSVAILTAGLVIENMDTAAYLYDKLGKDYKYQHNACSKASKALNTAVNAIKHEMGITGQDKSVEDDMNSTQNLIYALSELSEKSRTRVVGLIEKLKREEKIK